MSAFQQAYEESIYFSGLVEHDPRQAIYELTQRLVHSIYIYIYEYLISSLSLSLSLSLSVSVSFLGLESQAKD